MTLRESYASEQWTQYADDPSGGGAFRHLAFDPSKHVRDRLGQFVAMLDSSDSGVDLPSGVTVDFGWLGGATVRDRRGKKVTVRGKDKTREAARIALAAHDRGGLLESADPPRGWALEETVGGYRVHPPGEPPVEVRTRAEADRLVEGRLRRPPTWKAVLHPRSRLGQWVDTPNHATIPSVSKPDKPTPGDKPDALPTRVDSPALGGQHVPHSPGRPASWPVFVGDRLHHAEHGPVEVIARPLDPKTDQPDRLAVRVRDGAGREHVVEVRDLSDRHSTGTMVLRSKAGTRVTIALDGAGRPVYVGDRRDGNIATVGEGFGSVRHVALDDESRRRLAAAERGDAPASPGRPHSSLTRALRETHPELLARLTSGKHTPQDIAAARAALDGKADGAGMPGYPRFATLLAAEQELRDLEAPASPGRPGLSLGGFKRVGTGKRVGGYTVGGSPRGGREVTAEVSKNVFEFNPAPIDANLGIAPGTRVRVTRLHGAPLPGTMGHYHVADPDTGELLGLVSGGSLRPAAPQSPGRPAPAVANAAAVHSAFAAGRQAQSGNVKSVAVGDPRAPHHVLYSYSTPVAVRRPDGSVVFDPRKYSVTTSKQVGQARAAVPESLRSDAASHGEFRALAADLGADVSSARSPGRPPIGDGRPPIGGFGLEDITPGPPSPGQNEATARRDREAAARLDPVPNAPDPTRSRIAMRYLADQTRAGSPSRQMAANVARDLTDEDLSSALLRHAPAGPLSEPSIYDALLAEDRARAVTKAAQARLARGDVPSMGHDGLPATRPRRRG